MHTKALKDLIVTLLAGVLIFILAIQLDLFEEFIHWAAAREGWQVDELLVTTAASALLWVVFSLRRCRELHRENRMREEVERQLREARENLELQVQRRTEELVTMNRQLQHTIDALSATRQERNSLEQQVVQSQKLESIGVLASGVAHDFNNLLTAINGYADLVMVKTADYGQNIREDLQRIRNAGEKASRLTSQLLAFSRKQVFHLKVLDLNVLITEIGNLSSRLIGETIHLRLNLAMDIARVKADRTQMEQVLMNLLINGRDAMPDGGELTVSTANVFLDQGYASRHEGVVPGDYVQVSVSDTGQGMTAEVQRKIFDPFFTTKESGKGTGLGLSTVYGIVKQHRGNIWVYSEVGLGTTFKVYLPAVQDECSENGKRQEEKAGQGSERILVVDDDEAVRSFVRDTLEYYRYNVQEAASGAEALAVVAAATAPFDLLLTDVIMPRMNGWELSEKVRAKWPSLKVVFMSGYDDQKVPMEKIDSNPGLSFVSKPLTTTSLIKEIRQLLDA